MTRRATLKKQYDVLSPRLMQRRADGAIEVSSRCPRQHGSSGGCHQRLAGDPGHPTAYEDDQVQRNRDSVVQQENRAAAEAFRASSRMPDPCQITIAATCGNPEDLP